jgi:hypothetical protein
LMRNHYDWCRGHWCACFRTDCAVWTYFVTAQ